MRALLGALLGTALVGLTLLGPVQAQGGHTTGTVDYLARYLVVADDVALVQRDGLLSFHRRFAEEARLLLDEGEPDSFQAAVASVALGASGMIGEFERLRAATRAEDPLLRRAGVVALGELGPSGEQPLLALLDNPELGALAKVALLRSGSQAGRVELLRRFAAGEAPDVPALIDFVDHPTNFTACPPAARIVYDLRFQAARSFGLVDGQRWVIHLTQALAADPAFLDLVVFLAAADTQEPVVRDLVLERLVEAGGEAPLRAAARCMLPELRELLAAELYTPADEAEWAMLLDELERRGLVEADLPILLSALSQPGLELQVLRLLVELGGEPGVEAAETLRDHLADPDAKVRAQACRGLSASRDTSWIGELTRMEDDPAGPVRAAALVGRARLGSGSALADLRELLSDPEQTPERADVVASLCVDVGDPQLGLLARTALQTAIGPERLSLQLALRLEGDLVAGRELLEVLAQPSGLDGRTWLATSLADDYDRQDLPLFEQLFPSERHPGINVGLATALARGGAPEGMQLLRMAIWRGPWDRSQLAATALVEEAGLGILIAELESAPTGVTSDAFRRVGYSIGILGGLDALDQLQRRRGPADAALQGAYLGALAGRTF